MALRLLFLLIFFLPLTVFAQESYPINLLENQKWKIEITAEPSSVFNTQDVFEVSRDGERLSVIPYKIDLNTGIKKESVADYEAEYMKRYTDPKDWHLQLSHCWYKYPTLKVDRSCRFVRVPVEITRSPMKGDDGYSYIMTGAYYDIEVVLLEKDSQEVSCNFRGKTQDGQKIYYTENSNNFDDLETFVCFKTKTDAETAGYQLNFQESGVVITPIQSVAEEIELAFPDVPLSHKNYEAITFLQSRGIIGGYDNGNFGPDDPVTRVQALKILLLGSKIEPVDGLVSNFPDVSPYHWGQRFIAEANNRGIVNGNADGTFRPDATLNLAEALKMLLRTNNIVPDAPDSPPFTDVSQSDWYAPFASYAKDKRLVEPAEYLNIGDGVTRGELAELMYRLIYINENGLDYFNHTVLNI